MLNTYLWLLRLGVSRGAPRQWQRQRCLWSSNIFRPACTLARSGADQLCPRMVRPFKKFPPKSKKKCGMSFVRLGIQHGLSGFAGLFLAGLTAQSLSLVSTGYNCLFSWAWNASKMVNQGLTLCANSFCMVARVFMLVHCYSLYVIDRIEISQYPILAWGV